MIKEFKLGGVKYSVKEVDSIKNVFSGELMYGSHSPVEAQIEIAKQISGTKISEDVRRVTLYHEILHAMMDVIGYKFPNPEDEENFVDRLAYMWNEFEQTRK